MTWTRNAWNNFKAQPEIWFFYGFILTGPLSIRKVFFDYPLLGEFNEYSGIYLYLSDIFWGLTIEVWLITILYNKINRLSRSIQSIPSGVLRETKMFHVEHLNIFRGGTIVILGLPALLVFWSFITILWSNQAEIATFRSVKLFEFYLLYLFLALNPKCSMWNILRNVFRIIIVIGLINAIIGILQVIIQHSLGLFWLKESLISPSLPGVAKIVLGGAKYIRAYALFPHPNILGGFLFLSIILTLAYWALFHVKQSKPACDIRCANWDSGQCKTFSVQNSFSAGHNCFTWNNYGHHNRYLFALILGIQIVAGILTFSKSAILGLILATGYLVYKINVPCGTFRKTGIKQTNFLRLGITKRIFLFFIIIGLAIYLVHPDFYAIFIQSLAERLVYINISLSMISSHFLTGIGSGQFVVEMQKYSKGLADWQLQPVHNVLLLILSELGLVGFSLFAWFIWEMFHPRRNVPRGTSYGAGVEQGEQNQESKNVSRGTIQQDFDLVTLFKALLIGFLFIGLFDHYLWDIQQGQIMLWMALGFLAGSSLRPNLT